MKVALIDNGIFCKEKDMNIVAQKSFIPCAIHSDRSGVQSIHGTICAEIINDLYPGTEFVDLRVMNREGTTNITVLVKALKWCNNNNIRLIHMSIGTINYFDIEVLRNVMEPLLKNNVIIVAAYHNEDIWTYPAGFPGVFGVRQDRYGILKNNEFLFQEEQSENAENTIVAHWNNEPRKEPANSFAAPVITGYIAKYLDSNPTANFSNILNYLKRRAVAGKYYPKRIQKTIRSRDNIGIPVIAGINLKKGEVQELSRIFDEDNYHTIVLQESKNYQKAIPMEYYWDEDMSINNMLQTANFVYMPDILFLDFACSNVNIQNNDLKIDMYIYNQDEGYKIVAEKELRIAKNIMQIYGIIKSIYS